MLYKRGMKNLRTVLSLLGLGLLSCHASERSLGLTPVSFTKGSIFTTNSGTTNWAYVPLAYDSSHATPMPMFVWLHGCGGRGQYDIDMVSPGGSSQTWISLAVGGREGSCWSNLGVDGPKVLAAIADMKSHFNVDSRRVVLGGYSSGGDIGYPLVFQNADMFAGAIFENTAPSSEALTLAPSAKWKLNLVQISHLSDTTYPISGVRSKMATLASLGFPVSTIEKTGTHWDNDTGTSGTKYDLVMFGLPFLKRGWATPAPACTYSYSAWATCASSGSQTRTILSSLPAGCEGTSQPLQQACVYVPPTCSDFTYSAWSECAPTSSQTRTVLTSAPASCVGGAPVLSQACTYTVPDQDKDGIDDKLDACPTVAGVRTSDPTTNGCLALVVSSKKTADWGTGYCRKFYMRNPNPKAMKWVDMTIKLGDGRLRGPGAVWGGVFPDPAATGTIVVTPVAWTSTVNPGVTIETVGLCANYGPSKVSASVGSLKL